MGRLWKRLTSCFLAAAMMLTLMPAAAFAVEEDAGAADAMHGEEIAAKETVKPAALKDAEESRRAYLEQAGVAALAMNGGMLSYETAGNLAVAGGVSGTDWTYSQGILTVLSSTPLHIRNKEVITRTDSTGIAMVRGKSSVTDRIYINSGVDAHIILSGININTYNLSGSGRNGYPAVQVANGSKGNVTIELADGTENFVHSGRSTAGIQKNGGISSGTLTITGTGSLEATGGGEGGNIASWSGGAGIGSECKQDFSNLVIDSGVIVANGGTSGAGIGSGAYGNCNNITINGGLITAVGGKYGTGIGAGDWYALCSGITINGGTIVARGGYTAAGIGAAYYGACENIVINGGNVTATGGDRAAGIGGCGGSNSNDSYCSGITITGGTINATGGSDGAGIGGGASSSVSDITVTGGVIIANGSSNAQAIGAGASGTSSGNKPVVDLENGIVFENGNGKVYGSEVTIEDDLVIPNGCTLVVDEGQTIIVGDDVTVKVEGNSKFENNGNVLLQDGAEIAGVVSGGGTVEQDSGLVQYEIGADAVSASGNARWDGTEECFILTDNAVNQDGKLWFSQIQRDTNFELEMDFYTGDSQAGGDGIWIAFFTSRDKAGTSDLFHAGGWCVELDTRPGGYPMSDTTDHNHLALLRSAQDGEDLAAADLHLDTADAGSFTEDGQWHTIRIVQKDNVCSVFVDGHVQLEYSGTASNGLYDICIAASTSDAGNAHKVRNIKLTESGIRRTSVPGGTILYGIHSGAVYGCVGTPSVLVLPEQIRNVSITSIAPNAFAEAVSLEWAYIPESVREIGTGAFPKDACLLFENEMQARKLLDGTGQTWGLAGITDLTLSAERQEDGAYLIGGESYTLEVTEKPAYDGGVSVSASVSGGETANVPYQVLGKGTYTGYNVYLVKLDLSQIESGLYDFTFSTGGGQGKSLTEKIRVDKTIPTTPTNFTAETVSGTVKLSWSATSDAAGYRLYRSDSLDGPYVKLADVNSGTTAAYNDSSITAGKEYFYKIAALNQAKNESIPAGPVSSLYGADTKAPKIVSMSPANHSTISGTVNFTVGAEDDTRVTRIGIRTSRDETNWSEPMEKTVSAKAAKSAFSVRTTDLPDGKLYLKAYAEDYAGNRGEGATVYWYTIDNTPPGQVQDLTVKAAASTILTLAWSNVAAEDFSYFSVEMQDSGGVWREYTKVYTTLGTNVTGLTPDKEYSFRVCAYDKQGNKGDYSEVLHARTSADTTPPVVSAIFPKPGAYASSIPLKITVSDDYGVKQVDIDYFEDGGSTWKTAGTLPVNSQVPRVTVSYTLNLTDIEDGTIRVRPVATDKAGNRSDATDSAPFVEYRVDNTPPSVPTGLTATGGEGYVSLSWVQGPETDLNGYQIERSENPQGPFAVQTSGLKKISFNDTKVSYNTTYYYRICVADQAGNKSAYSEVVSAATKPDVIPPRIVSVSPSDGFVMSASTPVNVSVSDNVRVKSITYEISTDGTNYTTNTMQTTVDSASFVAKLPIVPGDLNADEMWLRVKCSDIAGLDSGWTERHYTIDRTPPASVNVTAEPGDLCVQLSWPAAGDSDLAGYRIYRSAGEGGVYTYLAQTSSKRTAYTDYNVNVGTAYSYYVVSIDSNMNTAQGEKSSYVKPLDNDTQAPVAVISGSSSAYTGDNVVFSGARSVDNVGVVSYSWDFGDSTTAQGVEASHVWQTAGTYTVSLTVRDAKNNAHTVTASIIVKDKKTTPEGGAVGTVKIQVVNENGSPVKDAGVYFNLGTSPVAYLTNSSGTAVISAAPGSYEIGAYKDGFLPDKENVKIIAGQEISVKLVMVEQNIVVGDLTVKRMTLEEIQAAGIKVDDPANQQVYKFEIQLIYGTSELNVSGMTNGNGKVLSDPERFTIQDSANGPKRNLVVGFASGGKATVTGPSGSEQEIDVPTVVVLDLPGEASWLKDFFNVKLTVYNQADGRFYLDNCQADLEVPQGLTLVSSNLTSASSSYDMGTIRGGNKASAEWILRGDQAGDYELSAAFTSVLRDFGVSVEALFKTAEPFHVRAGDGLTMDVVVEDAIVANTDGAMRVGLTNNNENPYYMPQIDLSDLVTERRKFKTSGWVTAKTSMTELRNGETLWYEYVIPRKNWEVLTKRDGEDMVLKEKIVKALGGDVTLDTHIYGVTPFTISPDRIEIYDASTGRDEATPIEFISISGAKGKTVQIPDLLIKTYKMQEDGSYQPAPMDVLVEDPDREDGKTTITTESNGEYLLPGHEVEIKWGSESGEMQTSKTQFMSYTMRFSASRAKPVVLPVNIRGKLTVTADLKVWTYQYASDGSFKISALPDALVEIPDANKSVTSSEEHGEVYAQINALGKGMHTVRVSKDGFLPVEMTVDLSGDTDIYVTLTPGDPNSSESRITMIKNSLSGNTIGNQTIVPYGTELEGDTITFYVSSVIAPGEKLIGYKWRIINNGNTRKEGEVSYLDGAGGFYLNSSQFQSGDSLQIALVTQVTSNNTINTSRWAASGLRYVDAPGVLGSVAGKTDWLNGKIEIKLPEKLTSSKGGDFLDGVLASDFSERGSMEGLKSKSDREAGTKILGFADDFKYSSTQEKTQWPVSATYESSGKLTITAGYGTSRTTTNRTGGFAKTEQNTGLLKFTKGGKTLSSKSSGRKGAVSLIGQYDSVENVWKWSVKGSLTLSQGFETPSLTIPVKVGKITIKGNLDAEETAKWNILSAHQGMLDTISILPDGLLPEEVGVNAGVKASATAALALKGALEGTLYWKGNLDFTYKDYLKVIAGSKFGWDATVLWVWKPSGTLDEHTWQLLPRENAAAMLRAMYTAEGALEVDAGTPMSISGGTGTGGVLASGIFGNAKPQMTALSDGRLLMIYVGYTGSEDCPTALYSSVFDGNGWSQPVRIENDGTPDLEPCLVSTNSGAAVVWVDFKNPLDASMKSTSYEEMETYLAQAAEISVCAYNAQAGTWGGVVQTSGGGLVSAPTAAVDSSGRTLIAWVNGGASETDKDRIQWAIVSGGSVSESGELNTPFASVDSLSLHAKAGTFHLSALGAAENAETQSLYTASYGSQWSEPARANPYEGMDSTGAYDENGVLYYISNGSLVSFDGQNTKRYLTAESICDQPGGIAVTSDQNRTFVAVYGSKDFENVLKILVIQPDGTVLVQDIPLKEQAAVTGLTAVRKDSGVYFVYEEAQAGENDSYTYSLNYLAFTDETDIYIVEDSVESSSLFWPGMNMVTYADTVSRGLTAIPEISAVISRNQDGSDPIASTVNDLGTGLSLEWKVPEDYKGEPLYLVVSPNHNIQDADFSDNVVELDGPARDLVLSSVRFVGNADSSDIYTLTAENQGITGIPESNLTISDLESNAVYYEGTLPAIEAGESVSVTLNVSGTVSLESFALQFKADTTVDENNIENNAIYLLSTRSSEEYREDLGENHCVVTLYPGEGSGTAISTQVLKDGVYSLPECTFTAPEGKTFAGWLLENPQGQKLYQPDESLTVTEDVSLTAQWTESETPPTPEHTHNWETSWSSDANGHWHQCSDANCTFTKDYGDHVYDSDADTDCNDCGYVRTVTPEHIHDWKTSWSSDANGHWHQCSDDDCTFTKDYGDHVYDSDADTNCNDCGYVRTVTPEHIHDWETSWSSDANGHWYKCTDNGCAITKDYAEHVYDDAVDTDCNICGFIRTETPTPGHTHSWETTWSSDANGHWYQCTDNGCAITKDYAGHVYDDAADTSCNTCGYVRTVTTGHTHVWETSWSSDASGHWYQCTDNGCTITKDYAGHVYDDAADTSCNTCGYIRTVTSGHTHVWETSWSSDASGHWYQCTDNGCTITKDYSEHVYDDAADTSCNTCGYIRTVTPGHTHDWETSWSSDADGHWHKCSGTGCTITKDYGKHVYDDAADTSCNTCGYIRTVTPGHTHNWETSWSSDADGHWHNCTSENCPVTDSRQKDSYAAHISDGGKVTTAASSYRNGVRTYSCTVCGYVIRTESIPAAGGSSGSGGGSSSGSSSSSGNGSSYSVSTPSQPANGAVHISPASAKKGDTVKIAIKPETGYQLEELTVTDTKGKKIPVNKQSDGTFTFTMPASKVTVDTSFARIEETPVQTDGPSIRFADVAAGAYYANAVTWAVEKGITVGTSDATFSPNTPCTRGQIVTFLWRAAGSPKMGGNNPFTDVNPDSYYYDAVLWAASQGITSGTSAETFSPDAACTRGQSVTFLYRFEKSPQTSGGNVFTDVAGNRYYSDAVKWAESKGVTAGTSAETFSPDAVCTRGQIVTFLYRDMA